MNTGGNLLLEKDINGQQILLDISGIPTGIYFFRIEFQDGSRETRKLIIKK
jgi:hypothetical protein